MDWSRRTSFWYWAQRCTPYRLNGWLRTHFARSWVRDYLRSHGLPDEWTGCI